MSDPAISYQAVSRRQPTPAIAAGRSFHPALHRSLQRRRPRSTWNRAAISCTLGAGSRPRLGGSGTHDRAFGLAAGAPRGQALQIIFFPPADQFHTRRRRFCRWRLMRAAGVPAVAGSPHVVAGLDRGDGAGLAGFAWSRRAQRRWRRRRRAHSALAAGDGGRATLTFYPVMLA